MTNLSNIHKKIKLYAIIITILSICSVLLIIKLLQSNTEKSQQTTNQPPNPPTIPKNPAQKQPNKYDFSVIKEIDAPAILPVYKIDKRSMNLSDATIIAQKFGFLGNPAKTIANTTDGTLFTWVNGKKIFSISDTTISYNDTTPTKLGAGLTEDNLQNIAAEIAKRNIEIGHDITLDTLKTAYFIEDGEKLSSVGTFVDSRIIQLTYDKKISEYPIYSYSDNPSAIIVQLRKDGSLIRYREKFYRGFKTQGQFPILSPQEAIEEVKNNKGTIVNTSIPDKFGQALNLYQLRAEDIKIAKFTKISLAYYLAIGSNSEAQPVYIFDGEFTNLNNEAGKIVIYLPAIKTK